MGKNNGGLPCVMVASPFEGKSHIGRRLAVMLLGLFILSFGIAMSKKAGLGTAPISCIPATLTDCVGIYTLGMWTFLFNVLLVAIEVALLGRKFPLFQFLQLPMAFYLGFMTDVSMWILNTLGMEPVGYLQQWLYAIAGFAVLAFGVMTEIRASLLVVPGDGLVMVLTAKVNKMPFHRMKMINDITMTAIACVISIALVGTLTGAREGTIFAAVAIGTLLGIYRKLFGKAIDKLIGEASEFA